MENASADGLHAKKKQVRATEQDRPEIAVARRRFGRWLRRSEASRLVFVDESGVNLTMTRSEARALRGQRVVDSVPRGRWESYSVVAAIRLTGLEAPMVLPGAMNTLSLRAWVDQCLCPSLQAGDIVIWDNLRIHHDEQVLRAIKKRGARLRFLPPYSPEFNPIEFAWSKAKTLLRAYKARTFDELLEALRNALMAISPDDCAGWFAHAGCRLT